jgi:diaminopimelate epimerase
MESIMGYPFYKYSGSGNDFILFDNRNDLISLTPTQVRNLCKRREGIGADGVILLNNSTKGHDFSMRIWNADGSEAEMCGNGSRSIVHYAYHIAKLKNDTHFVFDTMNGVYEGDIVDESNAVKIKMTELYDVEAINVSDLSPKLAMYLNTGVPHCVLQVNSVEDVKVERLGSVIRNDVRFPSGTNVNFFEVIDNENQVLKLRVYERGVEAETLCCGTGIMATAVTCAKKLGWSGEIKIHAKGGLLKAIVDKKLSDLYFQGEVQMMFEGTVECGR